VGIEALSRGAAKSVFVEQDPVCLNVIRENLDILKLADKAAVYRLNALGDLSPLPKPFDLVFMGPPYKDAAKTMLALTEPTLLNIEKYELLHADGLVIAQHHKKEQVKLINSRWLVVREEAYGDSLVTFLKYRL